MAASRLRGLASHVVASSSHPLLELSGAHARSKQPHPSSLADGWFGEGGTGTDSRRDGYGLTTRGNTPLPAVNSSGVSTVLPGYGVLPRKVATPEEACERLRQDGAVILTGLRTELRGTRAFQDAAAALPGRVFGSRLLGSNGYGALVGIVGSMNLEGRDAEPVREFYRQHWGEEVAAFPPWEPNCAHTDGDALGDLYPSHTCLLFAHQCAEGGENAIVDGSFVLSEMAHADHPELREAARLLRAVPIDQSEYAADGETLTGALCVSPIVQDPVDGKIMIKMMTGYQKPASASFKRRAKRDGVGTEADAAARAGWDEEEVPERDQRLIDTFKDAVYAATAHAPRFKVLPGEALLVDNHRCMHVREGYTDLDRRSWRVFCWVKGHGYGCPEAFNIK